MNKLSLVSTLGLLVVGATAAHGAISGACGDLSQAVCVAQVGDVNSAQVNAVGSGNGAGAISAQTASGIRVTGSNSPAADIVMPGLASGVVSQEGRGNLARVDIRGERNDFHVSQRGDRNIASQVVVGSGNSVAVEQGLSGGDSDNLSSQVQVGFNNVLRTRQQGSGNVAVQAQVPTEEAALLAFAGGANAAAMENSLLGALAGGADSNRILLEQNGDGNEAYLAQVGFANDIALRQQGGSEISIMQFGSGHSIGIEQPAGQRGVQILQY